MDQENDKRLLRKKILSCVCRQQENHLRNQTVEANGRQLFELV
jgi:hypothetical protein